MIKSAWISCSERLPEIYKMVIVYTCDKHITMAYMEKSEMWHEFKAETGLSCGHMWATHWQPLPEPPKEDNND